MNIRSCFLIFSLAISSTTIPSMHKVEADTLECVSPIVGIQKIVLDYLYEWQPRETIQCDDRIYSLTYSLDNRYLIVGLDTRQIRIFDAHTQKLVKKICYDSPGRTAVTAVCAIPNGKFLAGIASYGALLLYDINNLDAVKEKVLHDGSTVSKGLGEIKVMKVSSQQELATSSYSGKLKRWSSVTDPEKLTCIASYVKHKDAPYDLAYSPDGNYIATGAYEQIIKITNLKTGHTISVLPLGKYCKRLLWLLQNKLIIATGPVKDKTGNYISNIQIWDLRSVTKPIFVKEIEQPETFNLISSFNNRYLIFEKSAGYLKPDSIEIWDFEQDKFLEPLRAPSDIARLAISPDGRFLACASERRDCKSFIWENPASALLTAINNKNKK